MSLPALAQPVYMPTWVRVWAIIIGSVIALPPVLHMVVHVWMMAHQVKVVEGGNDWARVVQIVVGMAVAFPDPIVRLVRGWRRAPEDTEERRIERKRR